MSLIVNKEDCNWWYPDDGSNFWTEPNKNNDTYKILKSFWNEKWFPKFKSGNIYISSIAFFVFKTPEQAFKAATKHLDLTIWMGDENNDDSLRETVIAHKSSPDSFLSGYTASNSPFMILEERIVINSDERRKIHIFHILDNDRTGWIYAPNKEVVKIKKWTL